MNRSRGPRACAPGSACGSPWWRHPSSPLALALGAVGFWFTLSTTLHAQVEAASTQDAEAFAEQVDASGPESLPDIDDERFWQVIDRDSGTVLAASDAAEDLGALADREGDAPALIRLDPEEAPFAVAVEPVGGDGIVVAGRSTEEIESTLGTVGLLLAVSVPIVVGVVALTTWFAVGRSLAPVERMRRQVEQMSASDLSSRVDEPETRDEIGRLARTMNGMLARLEESQLAQRRFVSDASHELKSPLASLRQYAEVARAHPDSISSEELSVAVLDEGARLERLVQGMLVLTRADEGGRALSVTDVDLDDLLLAEATRLRALGAVTVDVSGVHPARVRGDLGLLRQVTRNLADNAARHARGRVVFGATQTTGGAQVSVEDDGAGIAETDRGRVFERFVRLDEARARDAGGSGLGLAIVREIVRAHGGDVRVDAGGLGGAQFVVSLPA